MGNIYYDRELVVLARAVYLATQWQQTDKVYVELARTFQRDELRPKLRGRFDRFAILSEWNYADPGKCHFTEEKHGAQGDKIPDAIEKILKDALFIPEERSSVVHLTRPGRPLPHISGMSSRLPSPLRSPIRRW